MDENEKSLIDRSKAGDIEAFEQLVEKYQKKVFNIALRTIDNYADASDMAQEVFIRVYRAIGSFKEQSSFSTWLYKITTNVCLDELRKRKNKRAVSLDEEIRFEDGEAKRQYESSDPRPEDTAEKNELKRIVKEAIGKLSEEHRMAIVLRDLQGFSYEEMAVMLNLPEGTVKSRINRARQALKNILQANKELLLDGYVKIS
ncbi:MAG: sigma-70 family RNA polymerase sigma factor [Clostridiales bacterium]|nr:sigma-70 family RNA polymerase sigma factor [Clostridiales bacterium]